MIKGIRDVKEAGHRGAQEGAKDWATAVLPNPVPPKSVQRQRVLDWLEMAEYGRFLLGGEDQGPLVPLASGRKVSEEGESWCHWAVFSLVEYRAWCKAFEEDDLTSEQDDTDVCPNCGTLGYTSSRDQGHHCPKCGDIYWTKADRLEELASKLLGGAEKSYGGPGRAFHDAPWARVTRTRILVQQRGGLDI